MKPSLSTLRSAVNRGIVLKRYVTTEDKELYGSRAKDIQLSRMRDDLEAAKE